MILIDRIKNEFIKHGGVLKTSELIDLKLSSRQIKKLVEDGVIFKIKRGFYELTDEMSKEEVIIARLFPEAVIFLESAMMYYRYTDRIPSAWQIAVDKNSKKSQYNIEYPIIKAFYHKSKFVEIGVDTIQVEGITVKIYDRDRTICDVLRYEKN